MQDTFGFPLLPQRRRLLLGAAAALPAALLGRVAHANGAIRIGLTPVFLDDQVGFLEQWRRYLAMRLQRPIRFVQRRSYADVLRLLLEGEAEFAWLCGFPYWQHRERLELVAAPLYRGEPLYRAYLIRSKARGDIRRLEDLAGKAFAYSDPDSNSGFLYVQHRLSAASLSRNQFFGRSFFTWGHRRVVEAVAAQLAQAGSVDGYVWDVLARQHPELTGATEVFEESDSFGFPPIVAARDIDRDTLRRTRSVLLDMHGDEEGRRLLGALALGGFAPVEPSLYAGIGRMAAEL